MSRKIIKRPRAYLDVIEFGDYIARDSLATAIRFAEAFDSTLEELVDMPGMGSPWESENPKLVGLHYWPVKGFPKHLIFFRNIPSGIQEVLRVCHVSQDLEFLFQEPT